MFDDNEEELSSDEGIDDGFDEDMEALTRACTITGTDINGLEDIYDGRTILYSPSAEETDRDSSGGLEDDLELFRKVQSRFPKSDDSSEPLSLKALRAIHPDSDNDDDDFETLCAVRRRFSAYDASDNARTTMDVESAVSELDNLNGSSTGRKNCKVFPDSDDTLLSDNMDIVASSTIEQHQLDAFELSSLGNRGCSSFPKSAQLFLNAIKKNRSCQKFLQSKLAQIEARMEENKKLKERVKILKDFQAKCRKNTSRALGLEKHQYIQLISAQKAEKCRDMEVNGKKVSAMYCGPVENSHAANYTEALRKYPVLFKQKNWTEEERENLKKGIRQQFQEMVLQHSLEQISGQEGYPRDSNSLDAMLSSIRDLEITPERCREFLPKVNWDQLSSLYAVGHTAAECEARWLNFEDPLINHGEWTVEEDKKLLFIVQEKGMTNWFDIAVLHGKNRTPFQCLARFQRSLNARIIKREWTEEEDAQLRIAVETFGDNDWQSVASTLEGRTGPQCSNRWHKSLHPDISRVGRWTPEESIRLKVAVMLFGPKNWRKIAQFVPGRTHVKCRERWFNCEDPSLKRDKWTEDEDLRLKEAIQEHGHTWTKVAKCVAPRTDNQCRRRWMALFPQEVPLLQAVRNTQKAAIISNFVDRESDRPRLGHHDFVPLPLIKSASGSKDINLSRKRKRKSRIRIDLGKDINAAPSYTSKRRRSDRLKEQMEISPMQDPTKTNWSEAENNTAIKRRIKPKRGKNSPTEHGQDDLLLNCRLSVDTRKKKKLPVVRKSNRDDAAGPSRRIKSSFRKDSMAEGDQDTVKVNGIIVYTRRKKKLPLHPNELIQEEVKGDSQTLLNVLPVCTDFSDYHLHSNNLAGNSHGDCSLNGFTSSKIDEAPKRFRRRSFKLREQDQGVELVFHGRPDKREKSTVRRKSRTNQVLGPNEDCEMTLASFLRNKSCTKEVLDPTEDCDVTLSSFCQNKSRKKSRQEPEEDDVTTLHSSMKMDISPLLQNDEIGISVSTDDMHATVMNTNDICAEDMLVDDIWGTIAEEQNLWWP